MKQSGSVKAVLLIGGGLILALLALCFLSPVQTAVARQVLGSQPGITAEIASVSVRPGSVEIRDLNLQQGPIRLKVPAVRAEVSLWGLMTSSAHVQRLEASDWEIDWDGDAPEVAARPDPVVAGAGWGAALASLGAEGADPEATLDTISALLELPLPVTVGEVDLSGRASWRKAGPGVDGSATVKISGRGPEAGADQTLRVQVAAVGDQAMARGIAGLDISTEVRTRLADDARLTYAELRNNLTARLKDDGTVREYGLDLTLDQSSGNPQVELVWREGQTPLLSGALASDADGSGLTGEWSIGVDSTRMSHLMLGRELPEFSLGGQGQILASRRLDDITVAGQIMADVQDLSVIQPELAAMDGLSSEVNFTVRQAGADTRITELVVTASGAALVAEARLLQGVELGTEAYELRVESPSDPVLQVELTGLPLSWIQPWMEPWVVDAQPVVGKFLGMVTPQGLRVVTNEPMRLDEFALAEAGNTLIDRSELEIELGAEVTTAGWQVELGRVSLSREGHESITLQARGGRLQDDEGIIKLVGRLEADIAAASQWPGLSDRLDLESGRMTAEFGVGLSDRISLATALSIDDLMVPNLAQSLPTMEADARIDVLPDGVIELHMPSTITRGEQNSDVTLNLRAEPKGAGWEIESSVSGSEIHLDDLQSLMGILPADEEVAYYPATNMQDLLPVQVSSAQSAWHGLEGTVQANIGQVLLSDAPAISRLNGEVELGADAVRLAQFTADVGEGGSVSAAGSVTFDSEASNNYAGLAELNVANVAIDPWLRWFDPASVPVMSGRVNLDAAWEASVDDLGEFAEAGDLTAQISSTGGEIRALGVEVENYIQTGQTVATLGALLGAVTGNQDIQRQANMMQSASNAAQALSLVKFDQLSLNIDRGANGDIILSDLSLISPSLRLLGDGRITYRPNLAFWLQPLEITLNLSARDQLGDSLQQLGLLDGEADNLGYLPLVSSFTLDGSLARIGTAELQQLLTRALVRP